MAPTDGVRPGARFFGLTAWDVFGNSRLWGVSNRGSPPLLQAVPTVANPDSRRRHSATCRLGTLAFGLVSQQLRRLRCCHQLMVDASAIPVNPEDGRG